MVIFETRRKARKYFLRGAIAALLIVFLALVVHLVVKMSFPEVPREAVSYSSAIESYHYYYTARTHNKIALTFDDGPNPQYTIPIAEVLKKHDVPATFFFIGQHVLKYPEVAKQIHNLGFSIGSHSFTHSEKVDSTKERLQLELNATSYVIETVTGVAPKYYRPPFLLDIGTDPAPNPYLNEVPAVQWSLDLGYVPVGIDIDSGDWRAKTDTEVLDNTLNFTPMNHIVLMHDEKITAKKLDDIITELEKEGYELVSLDDLLTPPKTFAFTHPLALGDTDRTTGGEVSLLQWYLYTVRFLDGYSITGTFDEETKSALVRFQVAAGLIRTDGANVPANAGVLDLGTREAIKSLTKPAGNSLAQKNGTRNFERELSEGAVVAVSKTWQVVEFLILMTLALVFFRMAALIALYAFKVSRGRERFKGRTMAKTLVSVIIPAWNEEQNIVSTIQSVIQNKDVRKEIIVIDDGSKDSTAPLSKLMALEHPKESITVVCVKNGGKANALNIGIARARGNIIVTMDADAIFERTTLKRLVAPFSDPEIGAVAGKVYTARRKTFFEYLQSLEYLVGQNIDKFALSSVNAVGVIPGPIGAWRKKDLIAVGGFSRDTLVEDQDMTLAILARGRKIAYIPNAIAYTETPSTIHSFLRQRFRWTYGTMQCFWKYKWNLAHVNGKTAGLTIALVNTFIFNIVLPVMYPLMDIALIFGIFTGTASLVIMSAVFFTLLDMGYVFFGIRKEKGRVALLLFVPIVRLVYRQLLYYTMLKSVVRALEGSGLEWQPIQKFGVAEKLFQTFAVKASLSRRLL